MSIGVAYDLDGAVVLITGGGSGIGAALAVECAAGGAEVVAADIGHDNLNALIVDNPAESRIRRAVTDVGDPAQVSDLTASIDRDHGRLDAAVLGAAIQYRIEVADMTDAQWRQVMQTNLDGVFYCLRAVIPIFRRQKSGAIVTFASGLAHMGWKGAGAYAATKAALIGLTKSVAQEVHADNIRANILSPGVTATPIFIDVSDEAERESYRNSIGVGAPEDVVPTLLYLISDASAHLNGVVIERRFATKSP